MINYQKVMVFCLWTTVSIFSRHDFSPMPKADVFEEKIINILNEGKNTNLKDKGKGFIKPFPNYPDEENFILLPVPAIFYPLKE